MADTHEVTQNLMQMYGMGTKIRQLNQRLFITLSGLRHLSPGARILDCGCGTGHMIQTLVSMGFHDVAGLDASQDMVEAARILTGKKIVCCNAGDLAQHFPAETLDAIVLSNVIHHLPSVTEWRRLFSAAAGALTPSGMLFIREPHPGIVVRMLERMSHYQVFYIGLMKPVLRSFVEESELVNHFFANWPSCGKTLLEENHFQIRREFSMVLHWVTVSQKS
ncbi:MAG: methyltransferase domain-containing protein [Deltaproteobacteria bacterium]|nr:methyltransferase domain-containing protein [Deltaproteobacteria bacterium]